MPVPSAAPPERQSPWLEIVAAVVLSIASLMTTWSTYQAAQWSRDQIAAGSAATVVLLESARLSSLGGQAILIDVVTFTNWVQAFSAGDQRAAEFYRERFRDEFRPAFEAWVASDPLENPEAASSPFALPEYAPARTQEAAALRDEAARLQLEAQTASNNVAYYNRNTLFLASALFFVALSRMFYKAQVRLAVQLIAIIFLIVGLLNVLRGPIL
ncbi:MAG TPA: hypothetical protein GX714_03030 [Chloroflexi bacterium]|jgi:hypothetical protein|nr:hypothetical protein [Chloroflexota bacterium]